MLRWIRVCVFKITPARALAVALAVFSLQGPAAQADAAICVGTDASGRLTPLRNLRESQCTQTNLQRLHKKGVSQDVKKLTWSQTPVHKTLSCDNGLTTVQLRPHILPQEGGRADGFEVGLVDAATQRTADGLRSGDVLLSVNETVGDIPQAFATLRHGTNFALLRRGQVTRNIKFTCN